MSEDRTKRRKKKRGTQAQTISKKSSFITELQNRVKEQKKIDERRKALEEETRRRIEAQIKAEEEEEERLLNIKREKTKRIQERKKLLKDEGLLLNKKQKQNRDKRYISIQTMYQQGLIKQEVYDEYIRREEEKQRIGLEKVTQKLSSTNFTITSRPEQKELQILEDSKKNLPQEITIEETPGKFRSPIFCVLGHVDSGKTKLLDCIRNTNTQSHEAGGITQQIGATYLPTPKSVFPGLLLIDTPGHASFMNLRSRGSSLCDIAVLVVDIMHGFKPQTIESIQLLRQKNTPFVVALNKIDLIYGWKQGGTVLAEYDSRVKSVKLSLAEQGFNSMLSYEGKIRDFCTHVAIVPVSAATGEGIPNLINMLVELSENMLKKRLEKSEDLDCRILDVNSTDGLGTTVDVILVNGLLKRGDTIVLSGFDSPIVTTVRELLTPDSRGTYQHHKTIDTTMGLKISAPNMENAIAGGKLLVVQDQEDLEDLKRQVQQDTKLGPFSDSGIYVLSNTIGSLEAILSFLEEKKIPVVGADIGPVHKKHVIKTSSKPGIIIAFNVKVTSDAEEEAKNLDITIFASNIIYKLVDELVIHLETIRQKEREILAPKAVFPCILKIISDCIFHVSNPIVIGVHVERGVLKLGTPLCIPTRENMIAGTVVGIQQNGVEKKIGVSGTNVAIKIDHEHFPRLTYGKHFTYGDRLVSNISRESIDILKANFREELTPEILQVIVRLKRILNILN